MAENGQLYSPTKRGRSSSEVIKQFNIANAKILAVLLVVFLLAYHAVLKSVNGNSRSHSCLSHLPHSGFLLSRQETTLARDC